MVVIVLVDVLDGTVIVEGANVVEYTLVVVVVIVVDGTFVIVNVAVGVEVTVTGGPATMSKVLIQAKVKPSMTIIQFPENIWLFSSSLPGTLLPEVSIDVTDAVESLLPGRCHVHIVRHCGNIGAEVFISVGVDQNWCDITLTVAGMTALS